jgi:SAM-dependent methyltransferase
MSDLSLRCPRCAGPLRHGVDSLLCDRCTAAYPVVLGIPDLRVGDDPYLSRDDDRRAAERLEAGGGDFASRLASYYEDNEKVSAAQVRQFMRGALAAPARSAANLTLWREQEARRTDGFIEPHSLLDVGCGTAPLAVAFLQSGGSHRAVALDVGLRWLVLARVRAREAGVDLRLVCANAHAPPFASGTFDRVAGESILEVVDESDRAARAWAQVLRQRGGLWLTTPNRRSLGPDPHTGRLAGGWMNDSSTARWATARGIVPPRRHLLTAASLRALLARAGYDDIRVSVPRISDEQRRGIPPHLRAAIRAYNMLRASTPGRALLRTVGPSLLVTATVVDVPRGEGRGSAMAR